MSALLTGKQMSLVQDAQTAAINSVPDLAGYDWVPITEDPETGHGVMVVSFL